MEILSQLLTTSLVLLYLCVGTYIGMCWLRNVAEKTSTKSYLVPFLIFLAILLMVFWLPIYFILMIGMGSYMVFLSIKKNYSRKKLMK